MSMAACYVITMHCDDPRHDRCWPYNGSFTGETLVQAIHAARKDGWQHRANHPIEVRCPLCVSKLGPRIPEGLFDGIDAANGYGAIGEP